MKSCSLLQKLRTEYQPVLPALLQSMERLTVQAGPENIAVPSEIEVLFPRTAKSPVLECVSNEKAGRQVKRVGVVLSGGQAAGGHNVISGLFDGLKKMHPDSVLIGFLDGPGGIIENKSKPITGEVLDQYRNQGGFDLIGSGRTKIETPEQFASAENTVRALNLDGLVIIGGDDSNTNAALLAEYFSEKKCKTTVVGVPKTIDGDLKNEHIEISFGFDSATKTYAEIIGNIMRDAISAKKYYYFIKLMGRTASHITLECALQTHPTVALIGEEVLANKMTIQQVTDEICDIIAHRALAGKNYGVVLVPEGIVEFIPEFKALINELNQVLSPDQPHSGKLEALASGKDKTDYVQELLTAPSRQCFQSIPLEIQAQLLVDRDPHGNVQVSKIETERLLMETVKKELKKRLKEGRYKGKFSPQPLFCGYEGRSCLPSNFDAQYCYALGHVAALLIDAGATGYMASVNNLSQPVEKWGISGIPLVSMMNFEERHGKRKPVIQKALVDINGKPFLIFKEARKSWAVDDEFCYPGPMQFFGPKELTDAVNLTLQYEKGS